MNLAIKEYLGKSVLFSLDVVDLPDPTEQGMLSKYTCLMEALSPINNQHSECQAYLLAKAASNSQSYLDIHLGLLYGILSNAANANIYFQWLHALVNDEWTTAVTHLKYFTYTKYCLLCTEVRKQLFWLVRRLVALSVKGADGLCVGLFRQVCAGDHGWDNLWTARQIVDLIGSNYDWVTAQPGLIPFVLFVFLRWMAEDQADQTLSSAIAPICMRLLKERFKECSYLGRELIRALWGVSRLPEFKKLWHWLLSASTNNSTTKNGAEPEPVSLLSHPPTIIVHLLLMPTPKRYLPARLTPLMEAELIYLMEHVKIGKQSKYEDWFFKKHLPTGPNDDPDALLVDMIRFIVTSYHPSNLVIAAPVMQRWAVIGAILKRLRSSTGAAEAQLALVFDMLFFDPSIDGIMSIEPAILLMIKSVGRNSQMTGTIIEFLGFMKEHFYPPLSNVMGKSLDVAMKVAIEKRVLSSFSGILQSPHVDQYIKDLASLLFPSSIAKQELLEQTVVPEEEPAPNDQQAKSNPSIISEAAILHAQQDAKIIDTNNSNGEPNDWVTSTEDFERSSLIQLKAEYLFSQRLGKFPPSEVALIYLMNECKRTLDLRGAPELVASTRSLLQRIATLPVTDSWKAIYNQVFEGYKDESESKVNLAASNDMNGEGANNSSSDTIGNTSGSSSDTIGNTSGSSSDTIGNTSGSSSDAIGNADSPNVASEDDKDEQLLKHAHQLFTPEWLDSAEKRNSVKSILLKRPGEIVGKSASWEIMNQIILWHIIEECYMIEPKPDTDLERVDQRAEKIIALMEELAIDPQLVDSGSSIFEDGLLRMWTWLGLLIRAGIKTNETSSESILNRLRECLEKIRLTCEARYNRFRLSFMP